MGVLATIFGFLGCSHAGKDKSDKAQFDKILNDPRVNSKEVGERNGIKYFQVEQDGKMGFRDLNGNIVIEPKFDFAGMFSEGFSTVKVGNKYGMIDERGNFVLELSNFEFLGSLHSGLASFRNKSGYGFVNSRGEEVIKPKYEWVDDFSEGLCAVRDDENKHGYIDTLGKVIIPLQFQYATKFENGVAKIESNNLWGAIDKHGRLIEEATHKYATW